jgi:hypothetical protein
MPETPQLSNDIYPGQSFDRREEYENDKLRADIKALLMLADEFSTKDRFTIQDIADVIGNFEHRAMYPGEITEEKILERLVEKGAIIEHEDGYQIELNSEFLKKARNRT